jgi:hypothetical protein
MRSSSHFLQAVLLLLALSFAPNIRAGDLPTFEDFRRIDLTRRITGHLQTAELMDVSHISSDLIFATVRKYTNDILVTWGAAELLTKWSDRRVLFESALTATSNSVPIALRYACAAGIQGDYDLALKWAKFCQQNDDDNTLPWLLELWILGKRKQPQMFAQNPAVWASSFRDYSIDGSQARIRLLEKAGYSAYSARRLGFKPDSDALTILKELGRPPIEETVRILLKETASYLQQRRQFLLTELVGETLERTLMALRDDADRSVEVRVRSEEIDQRRDELKQLLGEVERNTIDYATEKQMVEYFNDVLSLGEEDAMKRLALSVRRPTPAGGAPAAVAVPANGPGGGTQ